MTDILFGDVFNKNTIDISNKVFENKDELFSFMTDLFLNAECIIDKEVFLNALYERENEGSTYMGEGIAVPHGKSSTVVKASAAFCRCKPFQYESNDEQGKVWLIIMLAIPKGTNDDTYVRSLANISRLLINSRFRNALENSINIDEILQIGKEELNKLIAF